MEDEINPYQMPLDESEPPSIEILTGCQPEGFPHPIVLAWIGVLLGAWIEAGFLLGFVSLGVTLLIFPLRISWVVYARIQMRRHDKTWASGARSFVLAVWIVNLLSLILDGMLILLFATCLLAFGY